MAGSASQKEGMKTGETVKKRGAKGGSEKAGEEKNKLQQRLIPPEKPDVKLELSKIPAMASIPEDTQ